MRKLIFGLVVACTIVPLSAMDSCADESFPSFPTAKAKPAKKAPPGYVSYLNNRFGFSLSYPKKLLIPSNIVDATGSGETFTSKDGKAELRAYGSYNSLFHSLKEEMDGDIAMAGYIDEDKPLRKVNLSMKQIGQTWFAISGTVGPSVFYHKVFFTGDDRINEFVFTYPIKQKALYDPVVVQIERTFTPSPLNYFGKFVRLPKNWKCPNEE